MKKSVFTLLLILFALYTYSQCQSDQSPGYWKIGYQYGSFKVSDCNPNYNCHGFAISYFEKPCQPDPFIYLSTSYDCPSSNGIKSRSEWQEVGKYVQVCSEADCKIVCYTLKPSGYHSAVKVVSLNNNTVFKYMSKYDYYGPLVTHDINGSWYHNDNTNQNQVTATEFWTYVGSIQGATNVVGTTAKTFSVIQSPGVSYSWSIISGYEHIFISSGGSTNAVTLTPIHSGTAVLQLNVSSACSPLDTLRRQRITLNIQTNLCLEGVYSQASITKNLNTTNSVSSGGVTATLTCPNATYFNWQKTSGNVNDWVPNGNKVNFTMLSGGSISFNVIAYGNAGQLGQRTITFYNYGSFLVYPNPASSSISVDLNKELNYTLVLQGMDGLDTKEAKGICGNQPMDVSQLKNGDYSLRIYNEGKLINQQRVVIKK